MIPVSETSEIVLKAILVVPTAVASLSNEIPFVPLEIRLPSTSEFWKRSETPLAEKRAIVLFTIVASGPAA